MALQNTVDHMLKKGRFIRVWIAWRDGKTATLYAHPIRKKVDDETKLKMQYNNLRVYLQRKTGFWKTAIFYDNSNGKQMEKLVAAN